MYDIHPSPELIELFRRSPCQGAKPENARVIFVGVDANYSAEISSGKFFSRIIEYQKDGVAFWKKYGRHHPFLLDDYPLKKNTGGVPYHRNFAALRIPVELADQISFVELLDVPTVGNSSGNDARFWELFDPDHCARLNSIFSNDKKKVIFVSDGVLRRIAVIRKRWGFFNNFSGIPRQGIVFDDGITRIQKVFHFSDNRVYSQMDEMRQLINEHCRIQ